MKDVLSEILPITIPNIHKMEEQIARDVRDALGLVETPSGRFILSKVMVDNYMSIAGITKEHIKLMINKMPIQTGWVTSNPFYNMLSIYLITFLAQNNLDAAVSTSRFYSAVTCSYLKVKYFPNNIDDEVMRYTLTQMHGASVVKEGFAKLCMKVADATLYKYIDSMVNDLDKQSFYRYLVDIRNKLNQSFKVIAWYYYDAINSKKQTNFEDIAEKINHNINSIASSDKVINYVSVQTGLSTLEIENLYVKILDHVDAVLAMQNIVLILLSTYNGIQNIEQMGSKNVVNRAYRTDEIVKTCKDLFDIIEEEIQIDDLKAILYLAILMILSYRS